MRFTFARTGLRAPARGLWERTRPLARRDRTCRTRPTAQLARRIARLAAASDLPVTRGTTHAGLRAARRLSGDAAVAEPAPFVAVTTTINWRFRSLARTM